MRRRKPGSLSNFPDHRSCEGDDPADNLFLKSPALPVGGAQAGRLKDKWGVGVQPASRPMIVARVAGCSIDGQSELTGIFLGASFSTLGSTSLRTPSAIDALIFSRSSKSVILKDLK